MSTYRALAEATTRAAYRDKTTIFFTFVFPLIFLSLFGTIFRGEKPDADGLNAVSYLVPGVLSWGLANAAVFGAAFTLMQWRRDDLLRLIRLTPTSLAAVLGSRYAVAVVIGALQMVLFIGVALLPFFGLRLGASWPLALPVLVIGLTTFLAIGLIIGSVANSPEAVSAIANCLMMPMAFFSGSFLPLNSLPGWIRTVSRILPLRYLNDGFAHTISGHADLGSVAYNCVVLVAFTVLLGGVATQFFRWSNTA